MTYGGATVKQALRPFPQYSGIDTYSGGGDHSGHSTYHAGIVRFEKRYAAGLTFQTSYVFSKLLTDSDSYWGSGGAVDQYNRRLEKSIGQFDVTHNFKFGGVYDLPFGKGQSVPDQGRARLCHRRLASEQRELLLERRTGRPSAPTMACLSAVLVPMSLPTMDGSRATAAASIRAATSSSSPTAPVLSQRRVRARHTTASATQRATTRSFACSRTTTRTFP